MSTQAYIVYQDADLLILFKPSGIPTTSPDKGDCLVKQALQMDRRAKRLHPMSRLDSEVSGLVTFARNRTAIKALLRARVAGLFRRRYVAIVSAHPDPREGIWRYAIAIDPRNPRRRTAVEQKERHIKGMKSACTHYRCTVGLPHAALLQLWPRTGRTHQLRVHTSKAGVPIVGDKHYGGATRIVLSDGLVLRARRVMLHCAQVILPSRDGGEPVTFGIDPPDDMHQLWTDLGGSKADFDRNILCSS